ncbi:MAG: histone deacetylase [Candidatus Thermoplasmatota archaeon]|nr:histone deacetylase [Candidatus Thermoplasmatota archaeon]
MTTQIAYSKDFNKHDSADHPENAKRLQVMMREIQKASFYDKLDFFEPDLISEEALYSVHSDDMIQQVKDISSTGDSWIDMDTYVCKSDYETARKAAAGLLQISRNVLDGKADNGFALVRPPGHHATYERSMGFCLFNNAALTANELSKKGKQVLVFDCDVHHGNGTQYLFYDRCDIMYQSFHLYPHYPGTGPVEDIGEGDGEGYTINAPLSHGNGNEAVSQLLDEIFLPIARQFKPDLVIVSSGYDSHHLDPLGGLKLTSNFFGEIIAKLQNIQPKIVCTLEGGYNLDWIGKCLVSQLGQLISHPIVFDDTAVEDIMVKPVINKIRNELASYWKI